MNTWKSIKDIWMKIMYVLSPSQKKLGVLIFIMTIFGAVVEMLGVSVIVPLVQALMDVNKLMNNKIISKLIVAFNLVNTNQVIFAIVGSVICLYIFKNVYLFILLYIRSKYSYKIQRELSVKIMQSYMKRNYSFFLNYTTEECMRGVKEDVNGVYLLVDNGLAILSEALTVLAICVYIMMTDFSMSIAMIMLSSFCIIFIFFFFRKWMRRIGEKGREYGPVVYKYTFEAFQGIKEIIIMGRQKFFTKHYEDALIKQQKNGIQLTLASGSPAYLIESLCVTGLLFVVYLRVINQGSAETMIPQLSAFAIAAFRILPSLGRISSRFNNFMYACPSLDATYANMKEVDAYELNSKKEEKELYDQDKEIQFNNHVALKDVCWHYPNSDVNVLDHLNLVIQKGKSIAFIGESGAGKSTLADVILGILHPQAGKIEMDGIDVKMIGETWRKLVGYVPQSVFLTNDTIRNNIAFGIDADKIDDTAVWKALEKSQLKSFVEKLPDGLDTNVGERGVRFSGGQKQRVAIARALYYNPEILILDEATSALDGETEKAVMESIEMLSSYKTLIIVAHRLTTIRKCDEIYEIRDGKAIRRKKEEVFK